jgi:hypothetical protein
MANGLEAGDSVKGSDTLSWLRGERASRSPGRRDVRIDDIVSYLNDPDVLNNVGGGLGADELDRIEQLEKNLGVNFLRDSVAEGWSIFGMVDGFSDVFTDETGVDTGSSTNQVYDATGDYYTNFQDYSDLKIQSNTTNSSMTFEDLSSNGLTCVASNQPRHSTAIADPFGGSTTTILLDGIDDAVGVTHDASIDLANNDFTIEFWMYPTGSSGTDIILYKSAASPNRAWQVAVDLDNERIKFEHSNDGDGTGNNVQFSNSSVVTKNAWNHVSLCLIGTTLTFRIDGVSAGTATVSSGVNDPGNDLYIGYFSGSLGLQGHIDDIVILNGTGLRTGDFTKPTAFFSDAINMNLLGATQTADSAPSNARMVILHDPVDDSVTLNTDCTLEISMDGGSTFDTFTLTKEADYGTIDGGTVEILTTEDLTLSATSGTSMVYRFSTANNKNQRLHGVYVQWR